MKLIVAEDKHVEDIIKLYKVLFSYINDLEPYFFDDSDQDMSFVKSLIKEKDSDIVLSVLDDKVVGFAIVQVQTTPPYNVFIKHDFAYLVDLVVLPEYRSNGIASLLISECEQWAKERKLSYLELNVLNKNTNAYDLYLKRGFSEKMTTMYKRLDD